MAFDNRQVPSNPNLVEKVIPQNLEAEESLLGTLLTNEHARAQMGLLEAEDFYSPRNGVIYEAIRRMHSFGKPIDILSVADELEHQGNLHMVGGTTYLASLADKTLYLNNTSEYIEMIKEKSLLRKILRLSQDLETACYKGQETADNLLNYMSDYIVRIREGIDSKDLVHINSILNETLNDLKKQDSDKLSIDSGFPRLNEYLGRLRRQTLNIIAARPAMGKSALALNIGLNVALKGNYVAIFSLEMSRSEVGLRILSSASTVPSDAIKSRLESDNMEDIARAVRTLVGTNLYIDDQAATTPADIRSKCQKLYSETRKLDLIIIDYLQLMGSDGKPQNRQQEISEISRALKIMAKDLDVPVIALSQLSRGVESRESKKPMLSDLRESGSIEQDADAVLFLYRDAYYHPENKQPGPEEAELIIAKNRAGKTGPITLHWFPEIVTFREKEEVDYREAPPEQAFDPGIQLDPGPLPF